MKRIALALALVAGLAAGRADAVTSFTKTDGTTATWTAAAGTAASAAIAVNDADTIRVHVYRTDNAAASTTVCKIQVSADNSKWYTVATVTNATGMDATTGDGGEAWSIPASAYVRVYFSTMTTGTMAANLTTWRNGIQLR